MNESDIPIDIHSSKLQDWLSSRRIVNKNWQSEIRNIRFKINNAITDMPEHEGLVKLLSGAHINYYHCLQIVDILKTTEADSKNVFGRYGSQRMKHWQDIIKLYEKENLYLAESAQILERNIQYEIPSIKKQISKYEQLVEDNNKKINDLHKSEVVIRNEYNLFCQQFGIKGDDIKTELINKLVELPDIYKNLVNLIQNDTIKQSIDLYCDFTSNSNSLTLLKHVYELGNTTIYEYLYSEPPLTIEEPPLLIDVELGDNTGGNEIDFDIDYSGIDNVEPNEVNLDVGDIDWGAVTESSGSTNNEEISAEINFDISLDESGIIVENIGQQGGIAKNEEALTIIDSPVYREYLLNDLLELDTFLKMRLYELNYINKLDTIQLITFTNKIEINDKDTITLMLTNINIIINNLINNTILQNLQQIKYSKNYINILTTKLKHKLLTIEKINNNQILFKENIKKFINEANNLKPSLTKIIEQTKILQKYIENDISKRYKNRTVNLMGGINTI